MKKCGTDPNIKKTLVRHSEIKSCNTGDMKARSEDGIEHKLIKEQIELDKPTPCSSEILANYIRDVKKILPPPLSIEDVKANKIHSSSKITKKLNFHMNDKIYKNLIELNGTIEEFKMKREHRPSSSVLVRRDLEPNIEDFFHDEEEIDFPPKIPVIKPKLKPIRKVDDGDLHALVASFDIL